MIDWQSLVVTDEDTIRQWWTAEPAANVGLATGHAFDVIDVDGEEGQASIKKQQEEHGPLAMGRRVQTGTGGLHIYVRPIAGAKNGVRFLPGLDYRALGGQVVAPPSIHPDTGQRYKLIKTGLPIIDPPLWLPPLVVPKKLERIEPERTADPASPQAKAYGAAALRNELARIRQSNEIGGWNSTVNRAAYCLMGLVKAGALDHSQVCDAIVDAAAPWDEHEAATVESILVRAYEAAEPRGVPVRDVNDLLADRRPGVGDQRAVMLTYFPSGLAQGPRH